MAGSVRGLAPQPHLHRLHHRSRIFHGRQVGSIGELNQFRPGDMRRHFLGQFERGHLVELSHTDQRGDSDVLEVGYRIDPAHDRLLLADVHIGTDAFGHGLHLVGQGRAQMMGRNQLAEQATTVASQNDEDLWIWRGQLAMLQEDYPAAEQAWEHLAAEYGFDLPENLFMPFGWLP